MAHFQANLRWEGSTGLGWESYDRSHEASAAEQTVGLTTGESKGDPALLNPELLLVMAASSCQMLWFLDLASKARVDVVSYEDRPEGEMPEDRFTLVTLRPRIVVATDHSEERLSKLVALAHKHCNIANSLSAEMRVEPTFETIAHGAA
jgi:organic hydroperoxide reductase OsmC/OhrA